MATLTAASVDRYNNGSLTLHRVVFASVGTGGDTWASGFPAGVVVGAWANATTGALPEVNGTHTATSGTYLTVNTLNVNGVNVGYTDSTGTFTIYSNYTSKVVLNIWSLT